MTPHDVAATPGLAAAPVKSVKTRLDPFLMESSRAAVLDNLELGNN